MKRNPSVDAGGHAQVHPGHSHRAYKLQRTYAASPSPHKRLQFLLFQPGYFMLTAELGPLRGVEHPRPKTATDNPDH